MENRSDDISTFFRRYENRVNEALVSGKIYARETAASFAKCFVESSPVGVNCGKNGWLFRQMIPRGFRFYRKIGITAMRIRNIETQLLDDIHSLNKISWSSHFRRKDGTEAAIDFVVIYMVQTLKGEHKIFCYITGDEQAALKKEGLI
jgi:hypothetical protein